MGNCSTSGATTGKNYLQEALEIASNINEMKIEAVKSGKNKISFSYDGNITSLAGARVDLEYAQKMYSEAARRLDYTNSTNARESFEQWSAELRKAREAYAKAEERERKKKRRKNNDVPF